MKDWKTAVKESNCDRAFKKIGEDVFVVNGAGRIQQHSGGRTIDVPYDVSNQLLSEIGWTPGDCPEK